RAADLVSPSAISHTPLLVLSVLKPIRLRHLFFKIHFKYNLILAEVYPQQPCARSIFEGIKKWVSQVRL
ncbi:hypothetical protein, partial [Vreelandella glaciei]|uniref:hypothetical protein n=1 Tax=Vreelandella glaciei TaxID=186761 RepID=UPI0030026317